MILGIVLLLFANTFPALSVEESNLNAVSNLKCVQINCIAMEVTWNYVGEPHSYRVEYTEGSHSRKIILNGNAKMVILDQLNIFHTYNISVTPYILGKIRLIEGIRTFVSCKQRYKGHLKVIIDRVSANDVFLTLNVVPKISTAHLKTRNITFEINCSSEDDNRKLLFRTTLRKSYQSYYMTLSGLHPCSDYACTVATYVDNSNVFMENITSNFTILTDCPFTLSVDLMYGQCFVTAESSFENIPDLTYDLEICVRNTSCNMMSESGCLLTSQRRIYYFYESDWYLEPNFTVGICASPIKSWSNNTRGPKMCMCSEQTEQDSKKFHPLRVKVQDITSNSFDINGWTQDSFVGTSRNLTNVKIDVTWKSEKNVSMAASYTASLDENSSFHKTINSLEPGTVHDVKVTGRTESGIEVEAFKENIVTIEEDTTKFDPLRINVQDITANSFVVNGWIQISFLNTSNNPTNVNIDVMWKSEENVSMAASYTARLDENCSLQKIINNLEPGAVYDVKVTERIESGIDVEAFKENIATKEEERSSNEEK